MSEEAVDVLVDFMQDSSWHVRRNAAESLLHHDELGRTALIRLLDSEDTFARETARAVLDKYALSRSF
ncbi:MAG: HEAT repeat domain-containing protein [Alkalibacterium thalassium]|nr:HEAT repeat domain-containing protein [Alkalibacterium thalassium]